MAALWLSVLLLVACANAFAHLPDADHHGPPPTIYGLTERCDIPAACVPYQDRIQYSFSWLCCEGGVWTVPHILSPMAIYLFLGNYFYAWLVAFLWEVVEVGMLGFTGSFVLFESSQIDLETWSGSTIADAFVQGGLGVLIGYLLSRATGFKGFFYYWRYMGGWIRFKFLMFFVLVTVPYAVSNDWTGHDGFGYGLLFVMCWNLLFIAVILPFSTASATDRKLVWNGVNVPVFLGGWFLAQVFVSLQGVGWHYLPNDFYQTWVAAAVLILSFSIAWAVRSASRLETKTTASSKRLV